MLRKSVFLLVAVLLAACGTVPPPAYELATLTFEAQTRADAVATVTADALAAIQPTKADGSVVAAVPTDVPTEVPTLVPPTATQVEILPTATVAEPTAAPTVAVAVDESLAENDPLSLFIANADPAAGAQLVKNTYQAEDGTEWACATCHNYTEPVAGLGPSMVGVGTRAYSRVEGMGPYTYLYNSIRDPQSYVVPEFANSPQQMPHFKKDSLTEDMVYNIIAYLMTLK